MRTVLERLPVCFDLSIPKMSILQHFVSCLSDMPSKSEDVIEAKRGDFLDW